MGMGRMFGGAEMDDVFDVTVAGRSEAGHRVVQEIFLDTNG
jgi:hypothetical protein